jgi:hypothetical protein
MPQNLANFGAWWNAGFIAGPPTNNAPVSAWNDANGANNLTSTLTTRPLYLTNVSGANPNPGVSFDGVNDEMTMASTLTLVVTNWTVVTVLISAQGGMQFGANAGSMQWQNAPTTLVLFNGTLFTSDAFTSSTNAIYVSRVRHAQIAGVNHLQYFENQTARGDTAPSTALNFAFDRMGRWSGATVFSASTFLEILVYNRPLDNAEMFNIYNKYLRVKYTTLP